MPIKHPLLLYQRIGGTDRIYRNPLVPVLHERGIIIEFGEHAHPSLALYHIRHFLRIHYMGVYKSSALTSTTSD